MVTAIEMIKCPSVPEPNPFAPLDTGLGADEGGNGIVDQEWGSVGGTYYTVTFKRKEGHDVTALVEVTPEYPIRPPRIHLLSPGKTLDLQMKTIQEEVNAYYDGIVPGGWEVRNWLLPHQLRRLVGCLEAGEGGYQGARVGKNRRQPLPSTDLQVRMLLHR